MKILEIMIRTFFKIIYHSAEDSFLLKCAKMSSLIRKIYKNAHLTFFFFLRKKYFAVLHVISLMFNVSVAFSGKEYV